MTPEAAVPPNLVSNSRALAANRPARSRRPRSVRRDPGRLPERGDDLVAGLDERADDDVRGPADDGDDGDAGEPGGEGTVHLHLDQPPVQRPEQGRSEQREQHRHDAVLELLISQIRTATTPATSSTTTHQAVTRRTGSGRRVSTPPPDHSRTATSRRSPPGG